MDNRYHKPWKVKYETHDWRGNLLPLPHNVVAIVDCDDNKVVETDLGIYPPDEETAEYLVKCVNEHNDD